jgi:hypothetical protein
MTAAPGRPFVDLRANESTDIHPVMGERPCAERA